MVESEKRTPADGQRVEVLVNGQWVSATFVEVGYEPPASDEDDEDWWMDYYSLGDGTTIPADVHSDGPLPEWSGGVRPIFRAASGWSSSTRLIG